MRTRLVLNCALRDSLYLTTLEKGSSRLGRAHHAFRCLARHWARSTLRLSRPDTGRLLICFGEPSGDEAEILNGARPRALLQWLPRSRDSLNV